MPLNRSWHDYNESLIERGRILMDISFIRSSNREIRKMNEGKIGAPFEYSHSYIQFLAFLKIGFKIAYRTIQGIVRGLSDYIRIEEMHFTHIRRRILTSKPSVGKLNLILYIISPPFQQIPPPLFVISGDTAAAVEICLYNTSTKRSSDLTLFDKVSKSGDVGHDSHCSSSCVSCFTRFVFFPHIIVTLTIYFEHLFCPVFAI
jgi:hypothetical protein